MYIISQIYQTILDALFPVSAAERELFSLQPEEAWEKLPRAPGYAGLAVPLQNTRSLFAYKDERVAKLIWHIKYKKSKLAVHIGAYALMRFFQEQTTHNDARKIIIVPIPITRKRRRERGYNQCELLTDEMKRLYTKSIQQRTAHASASLFEFEHNLLIRTHHAARQTLKDRADRIESAKGIFGVNMEVASQWLPLDSGANSAASAHHRIFIIDDVITTGSTMFEAIDTLKKAGFMNVSGLSIAH